MITLGIMQGRLTEPKGRGIQFFPFENWESEFQQGKALGIQEIEWIFDYEDYEDNPLWSLEGQKGILQAMERYQVKVRSICFDYFMRRAFYTMKDKADREKARKENETIFLKVAEAMKRIGAQLIEIPLVDSSSIYCDEEKSKFAREYIQCIAQIAEDMGVLVGLETDLPYPDFKNFLDTIQSSVIRANYDSGNSSGLGYDHYEELLS